MSGRLVLLVAVIAVVLGGCVTGPPPEVPLRPDNGAGSPEDIIAGWDVTLEGRPIWATKSQFPDGLEFDGVDNIVVTGFSPSMDGDSAFTIMAWINPKKAPGTIFAKISLNQQPRWAPGTKVLHLYANGSLSYSASRSLRMMGSTRVVDGEWHHVALTKDGDIHTLYIDGDWNGSAEFDMSLRSAGDNPDHVVVLGLATGRYFWGAFGGRMDDVRFYDRALTWTEIQAISRQSKPSFSDNIEPDAG